MAASVAEQLNNAIYSLATLNPTTPAATILNDHWQTWFQTHRLLAPDVAWWAVLRTFWVAYAGARAVSDVVNERTPPASQIEPASWKLALEAAKRPGEAVDEAAIYVRKAEDFVKSTEQSAHDFARQVEKRVRELPEAVERLKEEIGDTARNVLFVTGALAIAWFMWRSR